MQSLCPSHANASDTNPRYPKTEIFYQPEFHNIGLCLSAPLVGSSLKADVNSGGVKQYDFINTYGATALAVDFAIDSQNTVAVSDDYGNEGQTLTLAPAFGGASGKAQNSGFGDIHVTFKHQTEFSEKFLYYGLDVNASVGNRKKMTLVPPVTQIDGTRNSGGVGFTPYIGILKNLGGKTQGGLKVSYHYMLDRKLEIQGAGIDTVSGLQELTLQPFIEWVRPDFLILSSVGLKAVSAGTYNLATSGSYSLASSMDYFFRGEVLYRWLENFDFFLQLNGDLVFGEPQLAPSTDPVNSTKFAAYFGARIAL